MAIVISRSETQLSATTSFQAMDNLGASSVSSSFVIPSNVSSVKQITISVTADGAEEFVPMVQLSGNSMRDGSAVFAGSAVVNAGSATGTAQNSITYDTNLAIVSGNSMEIGLAVTDASTISAVVTLQLE
jgi:hypothetical protein